MSGKDPGPRTASRRRFIAAGAFWVGGGSLALLEGAAVAQTDAPAADPDLARIRASRRILLKNGVVLTLDPQIGDFAQADVLIEDGKIRAVRPNLAVSDAAIVDAQNRIIIPGFADTHSHSYQGLLRSLLANGLLEPDYNRDIQNNLTLAYRPEEAYAGVLATALGMITTGTTTVVDLSQVSHSPEHSDACITALRDSGIRAVYAFARGAGPTARYPQDLGRLQRTWFNSKDQLLTLALTGNMTAEVYKAGRDAGVPVVQHLVGKDLSPALLSFGRAGLMRPGDEYIHCLGINDEAWRLIRDTGGRVSICAPIDMTMGHGMPAIQDALDHGFRLSLSSDHGVTIAQDMFSIARTTFALQRLMILQRAAKGEQNLPRLLTCRDMLEFATVDGARCANLEDRSGTLAPGKSADIVMLKADGFDVWPLNNAPGTVVNLMNPSHVENVFIAGKVRKWRGALVGIDIPTVMRRIANARDALLARTVFPRNLLG
jgi:5-methylthioadenosine/S-adenosylhomocysteine deaminase